MDEKQLKKEEKRRKKEAKAALKREKERIALEAEKISDAILASGACSPIAVSPPTVVKESRKVTPPVVAPAVNPELAPFQKVIDSQYEYVCEQILALEALRGRLESFGVSEDVRKVCQLSRRRKPLTLKAKKKLSGYQVFCRVERSKGSPTGRSLDLKELSTRWNSLTAEEKFKYNLQAQKSAEEEETSPPQT